MLLRKRAIFALWGFETILGLTSVLRTHRKNNTFMSLNPHQEFTAFHIRLNHLGSYINCSLCPYRNEKLCSIVLQSNTSDFHQTCSDCDATPQKKKWHWINLLSSNPNLIYWSNIMKTEWASYQLKKKPSNTLLLLLEILTYISTRVL